MARLFGDLQLDNLGDPFIDGTFTFSKGSSLKYNFKNLSGGERAAFDLVLDFAVKSRTFDDTVFCIDEPDLHVHSALQGKMLEELFVLLPSKCQLWIASHSAGMLKKALDLHQTNPSDVVFLDFFDRDFDLPQTLKPSTVDRALWKRAFSVALHDLADLVAPTEVVICEGKPIGADRAEFDAQVYRRIFSSSRPGSDFVSAGNCNDVVRDSIKLGASLSFLVPGMRIIKVVDRDDRSEDEIRDLKREGVRVLSVRSIENYLWSDEVLSRLCDKVNRSSDAPAVLAKKREALVKETTDVEDPLDHMKSVSGPLFVELRKMLPLDGMGNTSDKFCRDTLAGLVAPDTSTYSHLYADIFG